MERTKDTVDQLAEKSRERQATKKAIEKKKKAKTEFSKVLLIQESVLIWVITIAFVILAYICVIHQYFGELPWLTAMVGLPWTAYGVSQSFYYRKATKENTEGGIKYATVMSEYDHGAVG